MQFTADSLTSALWASGGWQLLISDLGPNYLCGSITKAKLSASGLGGWGCLCYLRRLPSPSCLPPTPLNKERVGLLRPLPVLTHRIGCSDRRSTRQFRWSIWRGRELVVLLPLLITMMSYICAVPGRLQSTFSYYPVHSVDSSAKWGRVREEGDGGVGESSDTATRGCRLTRAASPESLLPLPQSRIPENLPLGLCGEDLHFRGLACPGT